MPFKRRVGYQLTKTLSKVTKKKIKQIPPKDNKIKVKPPLVNSKFTHLWQFHHGDEL